MLPAEAALPRIGTKDRMCPRRQGPDEAEAAELAMCRAPVPDMLLFVTV